MISREVQARPEMAYMQVSGCQLKASPSSRLQGASLGTDLSSRDSAAGLRQSRKSTGSSETHSKPQCHIPKASPVPAMSAHGLPIQGAVYAYCSHADNRPVLPIQNSHLWCLRAVHCPSV